LTPQPPLSRIPGDVVALADYEARAPAHLSPQAWAYFHGAAADELTVADNQAAFRRLKLLPRVLCDLHPASTASTLLGQTLPYPILLAPVAHQALAHEHGELATLLAAGAMGATMVVSTQASIELAQLARQAAAPLWFQLYIQPDRAFTENLVRQAEQAGYRALVVTVDAPLNGVRNREQRAGFQLPPTLREPNLQGMQGPRAHQAPAGSSPVFGGGLLASAPTWRDIAWLRRLTPLPLVLKGILSPADARRAAELGADAIIVSNHGGRTLDTLPATLDVLPTVRAALPETIPVMLDGGIRRGTDILKALALGASTVLIGRPYLYALATAGAPGVAHVLHILRAELETAMALTGCATLADISTECLWRPGS